MFRRAQCRGGRLRIALTGPAGSGKTYSSLLIAKGLGGTVAVIDSENGTSENYSDLYEFDVASVISPFSPNAYIERIKYAEEAGYDILIIDSLSPAWSNMEELQSMKAKSMTSEGMELSWFEIRDQWDALMEAILLSRCHVILTLRTRTVYQIVSDNGKPRAVRIGLDPVCQEGVEYQMQVVFNLSAEDHKAKTVKDRLNLINGQPSVITVETGKLLQYWLLQKDEDKKFPLKEVLPKERLSLMVAGREE